MIILLWKLYWLFISFNRQINLYDQEKNETVLYIVNLPLSKGITNKENFQYKKWDLNNVIKSVIMMIMMKNIKMAPRIKKETVNEIFKKENNKEKKAKPHIFNNKKNNKECSNLIRLAINT